MQRKNKINKRPTHKRKQINGPRSTLFRCRRIFLSTFKSSWKRWRTVRNHPKLHITWIPFLSSCLIFMKFCLQKKGNCFFLFLILTDFAVFLSYSHMGENRRTFNKCLIFLHRDTHGVWNCAWMILPLSTSKWLHFQNYPSSLALLFFFKWCTRFTHAIGVKWAQLGVKLATGLFSMKTAFLNEWTTM